MRLPINVGIVGYGYAGRAFHAYLIGLEPRLKLRAVATRSPERQSQAAADHPGIDLFASLDEMLSHSDIQLVVIATPHSTHAQMAIQAARAGRHVVVDKAMCLTVAEADAMIAAAREAGVLLSVFQNRRWDGDFLTVQRVVTSGQLGRLRLFELGVWGHGHPRGWRAQRAEMGGMLYDWGSHLVDQALLLVGDMPQAIHAFSQYDYSDTDVESYARCEMRFADDLLCTVEVNRIARLGKPHWMVVGDAGALVKEGLDPQEAAMREGHIESAAEDPAHYARMRTNDGEVRVPTLRGDWREYYRNVADALMGAAELAVKPEEVRRVVAVVEGSVASAREDRVLRLRADGTYG